MTFHTDRNNINPTVVTLLLAGNIEEFEAGVCTLKCGGTSVNVYGEGGHLVGGIDILAYEYKDAYGQVYNTEAMAQELRNIVEAEEAEL